MDAAPSDADVKLYKASAELLAEIQVKLPLLLHKPDGTPRAWVFYSKTAEVARILDSFQEWPQLIDPILADLVRLLTGAFLSYCQNKSDAYVLTPAAESSHVEPLPRSVCRLLYVLCKVRSPKIIVRLLNNEPRYIESLLVCFRSWSRSTTTAGAAISWEERYIMLLWLSHLMLAPFELATISAMSVGGTASLPDTFHGLALPEVSQSLLSTAFEYLYVASKDRESASSLVVRIALREDMQRLALPQAIIQWCTSELQVHQDRANTDQYRYVGLLTLLYGMINSASSTEAAPFVEQIFDVCRSVATDADERAVAVREFAPSRKLLVKIMRSTMLHAIALSAARGQVTHETADAIVEEGVQVLLEWLADSDTPVRQAASKALGVIILRLDAAMAMEVVDAVLDCLNENMLLENLQTGQLFAATDLIHIDLQQYRKNVNAVDAHKWHGAMLTLGHVLFRRSPPVDQLGPILEALLTGLTFEQRSNVGTSMGVAVRDAACFGVWSLARKYSTQEVGKTTLSTSFGSGHPQEESSTLQMVANHLVVSSCLDPSGNLRRGASAALQELIGRHPDTIREGISVVQKVDYHAVARRSRAISAVAEDVSRLDERYHINLLYSLLGWRGCRAVDADSRRQAAATIGALFSCAETRLQLSFASELVSQISDLRPSNVGTNAATRHGLLLALTAALEVGGPESLTVLLPTALDLISTAGLLTGRVTTDLTNVLEATARLVAVDAARLLKEGPSPKHFDFLPIASQVLDRCTTATEDELVSSVAARANATLFEILDLSAKVALLRSWLPAELPKQKNAFTCKGRVESISALYPSVVSDPNLAGFASEMVRFLASVVTSSLSIETRVNAMMGVSRVIAFEKRADLVTTSILANAVLAGLSDYTSDQRGDVGSLLRLCGIDALQHFQHAGLDDVQTTSFVRAIARLSAEKLTKVRFAAWTCLKTFWESHLSDQKLLEQYNHQADISSFAYYRQLVELLTVPWLRADIIQGLLGAISGGTDDISQVAGEALVSFLDDQGRQNREDMAGSIIDMLLDHLGATAHQEDREVVPALDMLSLILEQFHEDTKSVMKRQMARVLDTINELQVPIADIPRIQALIRLLSDLALMDGYRQDSADRISRKLLHKWPKVRQATADAVFLLDSASIPYEVNWNTSATANKGKVVDIRKKLGVAGRGTAKT